jgi:hypothetical protein
MKRLGCFASCCCSACGRGLWPAGEHVFAEALPAGRRPFIPLPNAERKPT